MLSEVLGLVARRCATKVIKIDVEPFVDLLMKLEVLLADLSRRCSLLQRLHLGGRAVLIRAADVEALVAADTAVPEIRSLAERMLATFEW